MIRNHWIAISTCLLWACMSATQAADYNLKPGLWETTFTMEMTGLPAGMPKMPAHTERYCVRPEDSEFVPHGGDPKSNCKVKTKRVSRNKLTWKMTCNNQGVKSKGHGEIVYKGNTSSGYTEITMTGGPTGPMVMKQTFTSRRIGKCK